MSTALPRRNPERIRIVSRIATETGFDCAMLHSRGWKQRIHDAETEEAVYTLFRDAVAVLRKRRA